MKMKKESSKKNERTVIVICIAVIAVLVAVIFFLMLKKNQPVETADMEEAKRNVVVNENNVEEVAAEMADVEYVEPGYYTVTMATKWHFSKGDAVSSDARVDNVAGNTNPVYFDVFLADDEENPIYSSPVIPIGSFLENITLDQPLEAGTYDCVMIYHLVDEDQHTISTLRVAIQIIIES